LRRSSERRSRRSWRSFCDARLAGEPVDLSAEHGGSGWRLGWRWDLGERTLDDVVKQVLPSLGELPQVGIADIRLRSIYAECFSGNDYKGLSFGIADLSFLYVKVSKGNEPATLMGPGPREAHRDPRLRGGCNADRQGADPE
jgi:hypothetical protein